MQVPQRTVSPACVRAARAVAISADLLQIVVFPAFIGGATSIVNDVLDVAVAVTMSFLVGWHWAFLPSFMAELVPVFDLVPTWTAAVFFATRKAKTRAPEGAAQGPVIDTEVIKNRKTSGQ